MNCQINDGTCFTNLKKFDQICSGNNFLAQLHIIIGVRDCAKIVANLKTTIN